MAEKPKNPILNKIWIYLKPFLNWRFLVAYLIPFMLVNGWAWIGSAMLLFGISNWFTAASAAWLAILWLPWTPEKLITIPVAIWIHLKIFSKDTKTQISLNKMYDEAKADWQNFKDWWRKKKQ